MRLICALEVRHSVVCGHTLGVAAEAARRRRDLVESETDVALVAREAHPQVRGNGCKHNSYHVALLAVRDLVAIGKGLALPHIEHQITDLVAVRLRRRQRALL